MENLFLLKFVDEKIKIVKLKARKSWEKIVLSIVKILGRFDEKN